MLPKAVLGLVLWHQMTEFNSSFLLFSLLITEDHHFAINVYQYVIFRQYYYFSKTDVASKPFLIA